MAALARARVALRDLGAFGATAQEGAQAGAVVDQLAIAALDGLEQGDDGLAGIGLEGAVLLVLRGEALRRGAGGRGEDLEQVAHAGLGTAVEADLAVGVGDGAA